MKRVLFIFVTALLPFSSFAADDGAPATSPASEVRQLIRKVETKLQQGKDRESDFHAELKEFDDLVARLKSTAPDAAAEAAFMKALLYVQVMDNTEKGAELMRAVQKDFAQTKFGTNATEILKSLDRQAAAKKLQEKFAVGNKFPDFSEKDIEGKSFSTSNYKGKVVLVDFWATWCGPCRAELPNVLEAYEKYHSKGFEIMGISLDEDKEALQNFIKSHKMTWQQYFDGKGWENKLSTQFGVTAIPATFLLDGEGKIIARDLRGEQLSKALGKALVKQ
jgi:peroxiredoxin